jgi:serine/threonine protein kinase
MTSGSDQPIGHTLAGRYRLDALLARGGMARVYRARDERLERDVAVKVLSRPYADDPAFAARFLAEARAAAGITHPGLVHVYDSGTDGPHHFIVMELLRDHVTLHELLAERGPLPPVEAVRMARGMLAGLRAVHERGLVHCDVKSRNVMVGPDGAKLIDFGIARTPRVAEDGDVSLGSLGYMAPEQLAGRAVTPATDLFALGVVLYEAITGRLPYEGRSPQEMTAAQDAQRVRPPSTVANGVPARLDGALLQALRHDPAARFRSAEAMDRALEASIADHDAEGTQVVRRAQARPPEHGYVPPVLPAPAREPPRAARAHELPPSQRRSSGWTSALGTALVLGAVALVVILIVVPLIQSGREPGGGGATPTETAGPPATPTPPGRTVAIPDTIGMDRDAAIAAAEEAGLNWRLECNHDESLPAGIVDQEPAPGTEVERGSRFVMYSARIGDCE